MVSLQSIGELFINELFTEAIVAKEALSLPITENVSQRSFGGNQLKFLLVLSKR